MRFFRYLFLFFILFTSLNLYAYTIYSASGYPQWTGSTLESGCEAYGRGRFPSTSTSTFSYYSSSVSGNRCTVILRYVNGNQGQDDQIMVSIIIDDPEPEPEKCEANTMPFSVKVPVDSGKMVCISGCQVSISKCVDVDFEAGMTCDGYYEGRECGTPPPTTTPTTPPVTQDPTNPTDKTDEQKTFENIMHVIGEKLDGIKDAITGGNQNQDGGDTGGSTGGNTGGDVNVDMSETNAKIDETNSLIDELTKWLQGEDLGDDIFGDQEPPEKELTPQQLDTSIFSSSSQCPADARLSFKLLGGKSFTKTFEFKDWCDNLEIFGSFILIASYLFGAYIIVSKS